MFPKDLIDGIKFFEDLTIEEVSFISHEFIRTKPGPNFRLSAKTAQHLKNHMKKKIYTNTQFFSGVETEDESYLNE